MTSHLDELLLILMGIFFIVFSNKAAQGSQKWIFAYKLKSPDSKFGKISFITLGTIFVAIGMLKFFHIIHFRG